jgi:AcrR family transcriptional regulator
MAESNLRNRVLEAAGELFYSDGYGVSIDAVAAHAGVAKPTIYAHFGSKETLIEAMLQQSAAVFFADLEVEIARHEGDPVAQLLAPFDLLGRDLPDDDYRGCICINTAASFPEPSHPAHGVLRSMDQGTLDAFTRLAKAAGARQPSALARQLLVLFDGVKARGLSDTSGQPVVDAKAAAKALLAASTKRG